MDSTPGGTQTDILRFTIEILVILVAISYNNNNNFGCY